MTVPLVMFGKSVAFKVTIFSRRSTKALISAALFSVIPGRGKDEVMRVLPISRMTEHPDAPVSRVEPSVKARK
jgi:hypothetical protein